LTGDPARIALLGLVEAARFYYRHGDIQALHEARGNDEASCSTAAKLSQRLLP